MCVYMCMCLPLCILRYVNVAYFRPEKMYGFLSQKSITGKILIAVSIIEQHSFVPYAHMFLL